jgi:hypothetical protein
LNAHFDPELSTGGGYCSSMTLRLPPEEIIPQHSTISPFLRQAEFFYCPGNVENFNPRFDRGGLV